MTDPILPFLLADAIALLLAGAITTVLPSAAGAFLTTILSGLGLLLCLPPLLLDQPPARLALPIGPPGLSLHVALDPLSVFFLIVIFLAGTIIAAFHATSAQPPQSARTIAVCLGAAILAVLAADGISLTLSLTATAAATGYGRRARFLLTPILLLAAVCLLTPSGYAPRFDAIRAAPIDPDTAGVAATLAVIATASLLWPAAGERCWTRDALTAGILVPAGLYLLLRLIADLSLNAVQPWWGYALMLVGGATAVVQAWHAAANPEIDTAVIALLRRQAAIAAASIGLALVARAADLPEAATFAFASTGLAAIGASTAGTLATLATHTIGTSAGTYRLSRLGGLIHPMPATAAALSAALFTLAALPPSLGFATLWLTFQSVLSAPRTGGLLSQLPLAWIAATTAASAALAAAATLRLAGIALLGRPRTPRASGAAETRSPVRTVLLTVAALCLVIGLLPGPLLWILADPAIRALTGVSATRGLGLLATSGAAQAYLAIPVFALLALTTGIPMLALRRGRIRPTGPQTAASGFRVAGPWTEGMSPPEGLPFGDPAAQSAGAGFLPTLPKLARPRLFSQTSLARFAALPRPRTPPAAAGLWLIIGAFAALLLALSVAP